MCLHKLVNLVTRESVRFDNNDSESKSQVRVLKFPEENSNLSKRHIVKNILSYWQCQNVFREETFADQKVEEH